MTPSRRSRSISHLLGVSHHKQWEDLCEVAHKMGMAVRVETLPEESRIHGGVVRLKGRTTIIVDRSLPVEQRVELLMGTLCGLPLEGVYMPPYLREAMEMMSVKGNEEKGSD